MKQTCNGMWLPSHDTFFEKKGDYELRDYNIAKKFFGKRVRVALDIGAHCGYWSKRLINDFETVIAFEPTPEHHECLIKNCEGATNFTAIKNAVSDAPAKLYMKQTFENSGMTQVVDSKTELEVVAVCLDAVIDKDSNIDFIKIDVEGHEEQVIKGALNLIKRCRPTIFVEVLNSNSASGQYVKNTLTSLGYKLKTTVEKNQLWQWGQPVQFLHIPKTGGTALKNAKKLSPDTNTAFNVCLSHSQTLSMDKDHIGIIVRDPWKRFCSGFWERKTNKQRQQFNNNADPQFRENVKPSYAVVAGIEKDILDRCATPNDLITYIRQNTDVVDTFRISNTHPLGVVLAPITSWLGTLSEYKKNEHKVALSCSTGELSNTMKRLFNVNMPDDPFLARSRKQFNIAQSYDCSSENMKFFKEMRKEDYKLIEYIISGKNYVG